MALPPALLLIAMLSAPASLDFAGLRARSLTAFRPREGGFATASGGQLDRSGRLRFAGLSLRTEAIAGVPVPPASPRIDDDGSAVLDRGLALERVRGDGEAFEQSWTF